MVVAIVFIFLISIGKTLSDKLEENRADALKTHSMIVRMTNAASRPVSDSTLKETSKELDELKGQIPKVETASIAEAEALSAAKNIINTAIARPRSSLVGTESLLIGGQTYWQVRIKIDGGLHELNLIKLLAFFEKDYPQIRLYSFEFQPDSKGVVSLVVDYLYQQGNV